MNKSPCYCAVLLLFPMSLLGQPADCYGAQEPKGVVSYHKAQSDSEKALDAVLKAESGDGYFLDPVFKTPDPVDPSDTRALHMLSQKLIGTLFERQQALLQEECGGHYIKGELCGFDYSPILCGQDASQKGYLFHTTQKTKRRVEILSIWGEETIDSGRPTRYVLILDAGAWKLDGVDCGMKGAAFNIKPE